MQTANREVEIAKLSVTREMIKLKAQAVNKGIEGSRDEQQRWLSMCDGRITVTNITPDNLIKFMVFTQILVGRKSWGWGPGICF